MKIISIGDVVGNVGVKKLKETLPIIKKNESIDFVIVNGENAADGMGLTYSIFKEFMNIGVNVVTMGNHTWAKKDIFNFIDNPKLLRPANYPSNVPGNLYGIYECNGKKIGVINLIGRVDVNVLSENPFLTVDKIINEIKKDVDIIVVDFHAEATAEKKAMGYYLDGKVNIVFGTHTHIQTADEQILNNGTAYITDIGMTGPKNSIIGMNIASSVKRFVTSLPEKYKCAEGEGVLNGVIFEVSEQNKITDIKRIKM